MIELENLIKTSLGNDNKLGLLFLSLVITLNAKNILELGVREGGSTLPLLLGAELTNGFLKSVDINYPIFRCPERLNKYWEFNLVDSLTYISNLNKDTIFDLIYVDDWHDGLHVTKEIELLSKHINKSSVIIMHDAMNTNSQPEYNENENAPPGSEFGNGGVYHCLKNLDKNEWEFSTIPANHGLTILRKIR